MEVATRPAAHTPASKLEIERISEGDVTCLRVNGPLNESFDGRRFTSSIKARYLIIDLAGTTNISSFGIREWIAFHKALEGKVEKIYIIGCVPIVMHEVRVVHDFVGRAQ